MNKKDFARIYLKISKENIALNQAIQEVNSFLETVKEALIRDGKIKFIGRGTFDILKKNKNNIKSSNQRTYEDLPSKNNKIQEI